MRKFTPKEDKFLRENYKVIPAKRMAKMLNRSQGTARQRMKILKLTVPPEIIEKFKQGSRIKPGSVSWNKGVKMRPDVYRRCKKTMFKKGGLPHNTKHNGAIVIRIDTKTQRKYKWIRISKAKWEMLHVHLWKKAGRKIPAGSIIVFKDKNPMNCVLKNLERITLAENMLRNTLHNYPKPIAQVIQLQGALTRKINKGLKKLKDEK